MVSGNGKDQENRKVLVVEDDPEINQLVGAYVEYAGFHYVSALDGRQALQEIRAHAPCAILLDLMLPDLSGWEICRQVKTNLQTQDIPVIILTALDNEESRKEGIRSGAAEYVIKPFDPDHLLRLLTKHARSQKPEATLGQAPVR